MFRKNHIFGIHALPPILGSMQHYVLHEGSLTFGESYISLDGVYYTKRNREDDKSLFKWREADILLETDLIPQDKLASIFVGISSIKYYLLKINIWFEMKKVHKYHLLDCNCMHWGFKKLRFVDKELEKKLNHFTVQVDDISYSQKALEPLGPRKSVVFHRALRRLKGTKFTSVPELAINILANA